MIGTFATVTARQNWDRRSRQKTISKIAADGWFVFDGHTYTVKRVISHDDWVKGDPDLDLTLSHRARL